MVHQRQLVGLPQGQGDEAVAPREAAHLCRDRSDPTCLWGDRTLGLLRKLRHRGLARVAWMFTFTAAAYNLVRMRRLLAA